MFSAIYSNDSNGWGNRVNRVSKINRGIYLAPTYFY